MKMSKLNVLLVVLLLGILVLSGCGGQTKQDSEQTGKDLAIQLAEEYNLEPLSAEDANYTINMGYYNCS
jgi:cell division protein FtsB